MSTTHGLKTIKTMLIKTLDIKASSSSSFFNITLSTAKQHQSSGLKLYEVRSKAQYKPKMATMKQIKR